MNTRTVLMPSTLLPSQLLGAVGNATTQAAYSSVSEYALGDPGRPAPMPTLLITIFDNSGSVTGAGGTDPVSNRFAEAAHAFSVVARHGSRRELGAVVHFDTPSRGDVRPRPLTWWGMRLLRRGLRMPRGDAGSSELAPSLHRAAKIAQARPQHASTLVVMSDFALLDREPARVLAELAAFPGDVHAVVLGSFLPADVLDDRIRVTTIERDDPPGAVARAVFASLITHRPGSHLAR